LVQLSLFVLSKNSKFFANVVNKVVYDRGTGKKLFSFILFYIGFLSLYCFYLIVSIMVFFKQHSLKHSLFYWMKSMYVPPL